MRACLLAAVVGCLCLASPAARATPCAGIFTDVDSAASYCAALDFIKNKGITAGCTANTYCPDQYVTRAQMALYLQRFARGNASNVLAHYSSSIGGGVLNEIHDGTYSVIAGGISNYVGSITAIQNASIGGGSGNAANGDNAVIAGGAANRVYAANGSIGGGIANQTWTSKSTVAGGAQNVAGGAELTATSATVAGGQSNYASGQSSAVGGGDTNIASGQSSVVGGGNTNIASGTAATVSGGLNNQSTGIYATVGGGKDNVAFVDYGSVGGGLFNLATGSYATVAGGSNNQALGQLAMVGGGFGNLASGYAATTAGGLSNQAVGQQSFAAGSYARAPATGSFVWSDASSTALFDPGAVAGHWANAANTFNVRATGGVWLVTGADGGGSPTSAVYVGPGSGTWSSQSDRASKENFLAVDVRDVLEQIAVLPIESWNYIAEGREVRHIGPVAQDFHHAFGLGTDDKHIATVDADGVALAAIKGLNQKLDAERALNADLRARLEALERAIATSR